MPQQDKPYGQPTNTVQGWNSIRLLRHAGILSYASKRLAYSMYFFASRYPQLNGALYPASPAAQALGGMAPPRL